MNIPNIIAVLIPIVGIVMGIGLAMLSVYLQYSKRKEIFALYHQERMAAIEKGVDLPPLPEQFFTEDSKRVSPRHRLLVGLVWLFVGLGFSGAFVGAGNRDVAWYGLIPIGIGLANLIYYFLVGKKEAEMIENEMRARLTQNQTNRSV